MKNYFFLFFLGMFFMSCDKDISVPVGKGNYISVSTSEISSITTNSAKCSFIVNDLNNETVVEQGLCWEITSKPTIANKKIAVTLGTGAFPTNLTNLNPNQTYYVRSYVKLNTGVTMYGDEKYFITKDILPATFRESTITNITATSAQVIGSILDNGGSNLSDVGIVYGYSTNPTIQDIRVSAGASATSFTISLSGLIQNTTYNLRPYALNSKGYSYGSNVRFQTLTNTSANLLNGIVAYYPFNGNANDASGNNVNGTVNGPILASDRLNKINSAYNFINGGYIKTSKPIINVSNNFTVSVWAITKNQAPIKPQGFASGNNSDPDGPPIIHPTHGLTWDNLSAGVGIIFGTNQIQIIEHADGYIYYPLVFSGNFTNWTHITLVYENHLPKLYINGTLVTIGIQSPKQLIRPSNGSEGWASYYNESGFGKSFAPGTFNSTRQFTGLIDDYAIWNRVLTADEIKDLYNTYELIK